TPRRRLRHECPAYGPGEWPQCRRTTARCERSRRRSCRQPIIKREYLQSFLLAEEIDGPGDAGPDVELRPPTQYVSGQVDIQAGSLQVAHARRGGMRDSRGPAP